MIQFTEKPLHYLYESGISHSDDRLQKIFSDRTQVHQQVKQNAFKEISATDWLSIDYYYKARCELIHRRSAALITDEDINNYRKVVIKVLQKLFNLDLSSN